MNVRAAFKAVSSHRRGAGDQSIEVIRRFPARSRSGQGRRCGPPPPDLRCPHLLASGCPQLELADAALHPKQQATEGRAAQRAMQTGRCHSLDCWTIVADGVMAYLSRKCMISLVCVGVSADGQ
jgi:hypothetical protein